MGKDLNKIMLTGRLGREPEARFTAQGSAVTTFSVASGRTWKSADGERHEETEWVKCVAWNKLAEICNQYLDKGSRVYIEGRLQTRKWQDKEGNDRYTTEVIVEDLIMLDGKKATEAPVEDEYEAPDVAPAKPAATPRPARATGATASAATRSATRNVPVSVSDDDDEDLPF